MSDLRLLMDQFHRVEFTGTWRRLFSRVKKHIIWGVLKSVTGMQVNISIFMPYFMFGNFLDPFGNDPLHSLQIIFKMRLGE